MIPEQYQKYERVITVACVNFKTTWGDKAVNLAKILTNIKEAADIGSNLIVFPELALSGYECSEQYQDEQRSCAMHQQSAETIPGPTINEIVKLAREYEVYVVFGMPERDKTDPKVIYNSAPMIGPEGLIGVYRKLHLAAPPLSNENACFRAGNALPVFETKYGLIGILICYDFYALPELSRILTLKGVRLIINSTASTDRPGRKQYMSILTTARAQENFVYAASANLVGTEKTKSFFGHSTIAGPVWPRITPVYVVAEDTEQIVSATLNLESLHQMDEIFPWKRQRRTELINREFINLEQKQIY